MRLHNGSATPAWVPGRPLRHLPLRQQPTGLLFCAEPDLNGPHLGLDVVGLTRRRSNPPRLRCRLFLDGGEAGPILTIAPPRALLNFEEIDFSLLQINR